MSSSCILLLYRYKRNDHWEHCTVCPDPDQLHKKGTSFYIIYMQKRLKVDPKGHALLSQEEMRSIVGGSLTETLVKLVISATEYFFRMGVQEAKRMKALL